MSSVGKYELIEELGTGSMGTVYAARDTVLERHVALKTIRTGLNVDPEIRERFYREAKTCARLKHPNIVTVYDLGDDRGTAFIAMELLKGADLREHIHRKTELPLTVKLEAMAQICDALAHAHRDGIVHRDVKPSNLFLEERQRAKVLDFGIARLPSSKLTVLGRVLGTPNYMAPEQILNQKSDGRADLFSAAVVFFEFLVYAHPFQSPLIPRRVVDDEPDSLFDHDSNIPIPFEKIFAKAFQKRPDDRYSSAEELAADIRVVLDAMRLDSSPSFSLLYLPSNEATLGSVSPQPPLFNEAPDGEDPEEWRLSEFLRILPDFEKALEERVITKANHLFIQLREIEAVDSRFTDSIKLCESRLTSIAPSLETREPALTDRADPGLGGMGTEFSDAPARIQKDGASPRELRPVQNEFQKINSDPRSSLVASEPKRTVPSPQRPEMVLRPCVLCGAMNRMTATFCAACGRKLEGTDVPIVNTRPMDKETVQSREIAAKPIASVESQPVSSLVDTPTRLDAGTKAGSGFDIRLKMKILIGAAALFCSLLIFVAIALLRRTPPAAPFVATALVMGEHAKVYRSPGTSGQSFITLGNGTVVHILQLPASGEDRWLLVRPVIDGKPGEKGYVSREDLGEFDAEEPEEAIALANSLAPQINPTDADLARQIRTLSIVAARFHGTPLGETAYIQAAGHEMVLAKNLRDEGRPDADWKLWIQKARADANAFSGDSEARRVLKAIADLEAASNGKVR